MCIRDRYQRRVHGERKYMHPPNTGTFLQRSDVPTLPNQLNNSAFQVRHHATIQIAIGLRDMTSFMTFFTSSFKLILALRVLFFSETSCSGPFRGWLLSMMLHDAFDILVICLMIRNMRHGYHDLEMALLHSLEAQRQADQNFLNRRNKISTFKCFLTLLYPWKCTLLRLFFRL
eukprot:TRINITY_DN5720_c0_g1_i4.p1 TRINITY_DN5720_c0_g1~~TRINITY_DN5720_c0_g1_i4.p1  ORF type:complete len:194 (+),score=24.95 TRINITY_DN5720_c0_g1_i4:61-582(+)